MSVLEYVDERFKTLWDIRNADVFNELPLVAIHAVTQESFFR